jgi:hypothetical protein
MQTERDASFVLATPESEPLDAPEESALDKCREGATPGDIRVTSPLVTSGSPAPSDVAVTTPGDMRITPLVTPMSLQENNKKRANNKGKEPVTFSLFGENLKRWPSIAFSAREIGKIGIEFLGLFRDFGALLKPLRQPHAMKQAMRINEFRSVAIELLCYVFCYGTT